MTFDDDRRIAVTLKHFRHLLECAARCRPEGRRVVVKEHVVLDRDLQLVVIHAGDVNAFDLAELTLLSVHHGAHDRAGCRTHHAADCHTALCVAAAAVVTEDASDDCAGDTADCCTLPGL